jgi:membrane-bound lytic murein transglycosylase A
MLSTRRSLPVSLTLVALALAACTTPPAKPRPPIVMPPPVGPVAVPAPEPAVPPPKPQPQAVMTPSTFSATRGHA